jgi:hypothetical protein
MLANLQLKYGDNLLIFLLDELSNDDFSFRKDLRRTASWVPQQHWDFSCYSHNRDVIRPVFSLNVG